MGFRGSSADDKFRSYAENVHNSFRPRKSEVEWVAFDPMDM